jgi:hypothetical protein
LHKGFENAKSGVFQAAVFLRRETRRIPNNTVAARAKVLGSGTGLAAGAIVKDLGELSPVISEGFTVAPEVVYSPIVPV